MLANSFSRQCVAAGVLRPPVLVGIRRSCAPVRAPGLRGAHRNRCIAHHEAELQAPAPSSRQGWRTPSLEQLEQYKIGQLVSGVVRSVRSYAAFVELGNGVGSMLKVGELSADYVDDARAVLREGDSVTALVTRVMRTGAEQGRIELSTRHLEPSKGDMLRSPQLVYDKAEEMAERWREKEALRQPPRGQRRKGQQDAEAGLPAEVLDRYQVGYAYPGVVTYTKPHRAIVELEEGVRGVLPVNRVSHDRVVSVTEVLHLGDRVKVMVMFQEPDRGHIELSTRTLEPMAGAMLTDPQLVYDKAEETARRWREEQEWLQREQEANLQVQGGQAQPMDGTNAKPSKDFNRFQAGSVVSGVVKAVTPYNVHVELPCGTMGVLRAIEVSRRPVEEVGQVLREGDNVTALVAAVKLRKGHLWLSTRLLEPTPGDMLRDPQLVYDKAEEMAQRWREEQEERRGQEGKAKLVHFRVGYVYGGFVQSVKPYGAFVELEGGVSALLHISQISHDRIKVIDDVLHEGDRVKVMVIGNDYDTGRITLSTKRLESTPGDMLRDPNIVYDKADEVAMRIRNIAAKRK